jgi:MFS family permease
MPNRWVILAVLFLARTAMAFQFQSVAALSPFAMESLAITVADIGLLIGLYLGPGIVVAIGGGAVAAWLGDKRTIIASLVLMIAGGVMISIAPGLLWAAAGRVVAGIGGVVINVVMTKMVIDWFAGRSVSTALAIYISSWPLGIALSLLVLPPLAATGGLGLAWSAPTMLTVAALVLFAMLYRSPKAGGPPQRATVTLALPWAPLAAAGIVWGLYNAAFAMIFGFGNLVLVGRGFSPEQAGSAIGLYIIAAAVAIPLGGWLADRSGRGDLIVYASLVAGIVFFPAILGLPDSLIVPVLILGGLVVGLAPGPVVAMPGAVLPPEMRAFGTGVFYSIYYVQMMIAPPIAGALADGFQDVTLAFVMGAVMMAAAVVANVAFGRTARAPAVARQG